VRERSYVEAARVRGRSLRIIFTHIAPSILPLSFVYAAIAIGWPSDRGERELLGFGDPDTVSWGYMLQDAFTSQALSRGAYIGSDAPGALHRAMSSPASSSAAATRRSSSKLRDYMAILAVDDLQVEYRTARGTVRAVRAASRCRGRRGRPRRRVGCGKTRWRAPSWASCRATPPSSAAPSASAAAIFCG